MRDPRFGAAINCIDGRVQEPVARWLRERYHLDHVDVITEPGVDGALLTQPDLAEQIRSKVILSIQRHAASVVAIAGHHDCLANQISADEHREQIRRCAKMLRLSWNLPATVAGLWVNERWEVEEVSD
jgi:hypothetical protein